jgi:hypothetical protein
MVMVRHAFVESPVDVGAPLDHVAIAGKVGPIADLQTVIRSIDHRHPVHLKLSLVGEHGAQGLLLVKRCPFGRSWRLGRRWPLSQRRSPSTARRERWGRGYGLAPFFGAQVGYFNSVMALP